MEETADELAIPEEDIVQADELETRGYYNVTSVVDARVPLKLLQLAASRHNVVKDEETGFFWYEQMPVYANRVLRIRPVPHSFFAVTEKKRVEFPEMQFQTLKLVSRTLENVRPAQSMWGRTSIYGWPNLMYAWEKDGAVYLRKAFTEETWGRLDPLLKNYFLADPETRLGLPSRKK